MRKYDQYKDSGIEWIGEVPTHWVDTKVKHVAEVTLGKMLTNEDKGDYVLKPYLRSANIDWFDVNVNDIKEMWFSKNELKKLRLAKGDLLMSEGGEVGRTCIWKDEIPECYIQNSVHKIRCSETVNSTYLLYLMAAYGFRGAFDSIVNRISIAHLTFEKVREIELSIPPIQEQNSMVEYLNNRCDKIDASVLQKQQLIDLLNEEKAAIINHAVTKGIDTDAPMKPSGIEWLGVIPAHWEVKKLKFISPSISVGLVINPSTYFEDDGVIPMITGKNVRPFTIDISDVKRISRKSNDELHKTQVHENDIVVVRVGYPGVAAVVPKEMDGYNCASMMIVRSGNFNSQFICMVFNSQIGKEQVRVVEYGAAQKQFNISHAVDFIFPYPPVEEQNTICKYISLESSKIDTAIEKIEKEIELLQEYKTSLIYEVVTGKVKVDAPVEELLETAL